MSVSDFKRFHAMGDINVGMKIGLRSILSPTKIQFQNNTATMATPCASANTLNFRGISSTTCSISGVRNPVGDTDAGTKVFADSHFACCALKWKPSCTVTDTGSNVVLPGTLTIDDVTLAIGERALLKNQTTALENGVYVVNGSSQLERATDMLVGTSVETFAYYVEEGTLYSEYSYIVTNHTPTDVVGTDVILFNIFNGEPVNPGGVSGSLQYNNADVFTGVSTLTSDGTDATTNGADLGIGDTDELQIGDASDLIFSHDATDSFLLSKTGDLVIDNTNTTGGTYAVLGTDDANTDFQVQNDSASPLFVVTGGGLVSIGPTFSSDGTDITLNGGDFNIQDTDELRFGDSADLTITHNATDSVVASATGDLVLDNMNVTGSSLVKLGTDTAATEFQIQNNSSAPSFSATGAGLVSIGSTFTSDGSHLTLDGGNLSLATDDTLQFGDAGEFSLKYASSMAQISTSTGLLLIVNVDATKDMFFRLGSSDANTEFQLQDSASSSLFKVIGDGKTEFSNTTDSASHGSGSILVSGGVGVGESLYIGGGTFQCSLGGDGSNGLSVGVSTESTNPGLIYSVSNISGNYSKYATTNIPDATSTDRYVSDKHTSSSFGTRTYNGAKGFTPQASATTDLGGNSLRWNNIFTGALNITVGTVTQTGGMGSAVTLNTQAGVITCYVSPSVPSNNGKNFWVNNNRTTTSSVVIMTLEQNAGGGAMLFSAINKTPQNGRFSVKINNRDSISGTLQYKIHYLVI